MDVGGQHAAVILIQHRTDNRGQAPSPAGRDARFSYGFGSGGTSSGAYFDLRLSIYVGCSGGSTPRDLFYVVKVFKVADWQHVALDDKSCAAAAPLSLLLVHFAPTKRVDDPRFFEMQRQPN